MSHTSRENTLDVAVRKALVYTKSPEYNYKLFMQFAIDGLRELYGGVINGATTMVKKTPNAIHRIPFPPDMIDFLALGVPKDGKIWCLTERGDIITTYSEDEDGVYLDPGAGEGVTLPQAQFEGIKAVGGVNTEGYFTIDWDERVIVILDNNQRSEYLLHYRRSGTNIEGTTYVPVDAIDALVSYIAWKNVRWDMSIPIGLRREAEKEWRTARLELAKHKLFVNGIRSFWDNWAKHTNLLRR